VEDYRRIRRLHRDGLSIRAIARTLHHSRRKVREALATPEPRPYTRAKDPPAPVLGPFKPIIGAILADDEHEKPHTENRICSLQRWWATPVPRVHDFAELNAHVRRRCLTGAAGVTTSSLPGRQW